MAKDRGTRGGFALIELPLVILSLLALAGLGLFAVALFRNGTMTAAAWLGLCLAVPLPAVLTWLLVTDRMLSRPGSEKKREP